jgi:hypothetical protein
MRVFVSRTEPVSDLKELKSERVPLRSILPFAIVFIVIKPSGPLVVSVRFLPRPSLSLILAKEYQLTGNM